MLWYDTVALAHDKALFGVLPNAGVFREFGDLLRQGSTDLQGTVPGGPATPGITAILVLSIGAVAILVDALAATYAVAPLVGLPLLALYLVPAMRVGGGYDWLAFVLTAGGYTALLSAEGRERLGRWGRPLVHAGMRRGEGGVETGAPAGGPGRHRPDRGHRASDHDDRARGRGVAPVFISTISSGLFGLGPNGSGNGSGTGNGSVSISQSLDFRGSLTSSPHDVLTYTTSNNEPVYLRLESDDNYDGSTWSPTPNIANTPVPPTGVIATGIPGMSDATAAAARDIPQIKTSVDYLGTVYENPVPAEHVFTLPAPYPETSISMPTGGPTWSYNSQTYALTSTTQIPKNYQYTVTSQGVDSSAADIPKSLLDDSPQLDVPTANLLGVGGDLKLPAGVSSQVRWPRSGWPGSGTSPFEKAQLLENFFQSKPFTYSTNVPVPQNGNDAMDYLLTNYKGYCQYYAWTMATMARELGIPARVAVGFAGGTEKDGTYTVTTHDLHAWPELYFAGIGWLRFEPTPGVGTAVHSSIPGYAVAGPTTKPTTTPSTAVSTGPAATNTAPSCSQAQRKADACPSNNANNAAHANQPFGYLGWFGAVPRFFDYWLFGGSPGAIVLRFVLLALLLLASVPMLLRILRRRRRGRIACGRACANGRIRTPGIWSGTPRRVPRPGPRSRTASGSGCWRPGPRSGTPRPISATPGRRPRRRGRTRSGSSSRRGSRGPRSTPWTG